MTNKNHKHFVEFAQWMRQYLESQGWEFSSEDRMDQYDVHYFHWIKPQGKNGEGLPIKASVSLHSNYVNMGIPGNKSASNLQNPTARMFQRNLRDMVQAVMGTKGGSFKQRVDDFKESNPKMEWWRS